MKLRTYCLNFSLLQNDRFFFILSTEVDKVLPKDFCFTNIFPCWFLVPLELKNALESGSLKWTLFRIPPPAALPRSIVVPPPRKVWFSFMIPFWKISNCLDSSVLGNIFGSEFNLISGAFFLGTLFIIFLESSQTDSLEVSFLVGAFGCKKGKNLSSCKQIKRWKLRLTLGWTRLIFSRLKNKVLVIWILPFAK